MMLESLKDRIRSGHLIQSAWFLGHNANGVARVYYRARPSKIVTRTRQRHGLESAEYHAAKGTQAAAIAFRYAVARAVESFAALALALAL